MITVKKLLKFLTSKKFVGAMFLLLQLGLFYMGYYAVNEYSTILMGGSTFLGVVGIIYILNQDTDSGIKASWIFLVAVLPVFGLFLYAFIHMDFPSGKIRAKLRNVYDATSYLNEDDDYELMKLQNEKLPDIGTFNYLDKHAGYPPYSNTYAKYVPLGDDALEIIIDELKKATKFIFLEFFIISEKSRMWKEIYHVLRDKIYEGVEVRVLFDGMGSLLTTSSSFKEKLKKHGIKCMEFAPVKPFLSSYHNNRDHRKIIVIDNKTAFSGGINIADEYINERKLYGHWKDNSIMLKGDAVKSFTLMFLRMWSVVGGIDEVYEKYLGDRNLDYRSFDDGHIVPFDDSPFRTERVGKSVYTDIINTSNEYLYIMTPYLVLDSELLSSLKYAAKRGVDVKIVMPHIPDKWYAFAHARTYYPELIKSGVKIYEYTHGFVHSKTTLSDNIKAVVGTINYDYRSLYHNYECGVYLYANSCLEDIKADFDDTLQKSKLFTLDDYYSTSIFLRFVGRVLRAFAPLM